MLKRSLTALFSTLVVLALFGAGALTPTATGAPPSTWPAPDSNPLRMWYTSPVTDWESQALVLGNGSTGMMAFGGPANERLHVNDKTLWRGGPAAGRNYIGGNRTTAITQTQLENYRQALDERSTHVFGLPAGQANSQLTGLMFGDGVGMGQFQDFGDIFLAFDSITDAGAASYVRDLDLTTGVSTVGFDHAGVRYGREYFVSYPDRVAVVKLTASEPGRLSFTTTADSATGFSTTVTADAQAKRLTMSGQVTDNQMKGELQLRVDNTGGTVTSTDGSSLRVTGADEVTLVYSTGTNYANTYPTYRGPDPHAEITTRVDTAVAAGYETLLQRHIADYKELFERVSFDIDASVAQVPTDQLMRNYRNGQRDLAVDVLAYQFGRYLSIAGSREGDLPTNLVGLWMVGDASRFWGADYHFNVNVQMNYWPAMSTNLAETQVPFNEYVESLVVPGRLTAERSAAVRTPNFATTPVGEGNGFLVNTQVNPFGHTAPIGSQEYGWNLGGSSWALQNIYDYYLFTGDTAFLREHAYPMLKEMAQFWNQYLWWSDYQQRLTVAPGVSAEHGPTAVGTAYDQSIVWELYRMAIEAAETLDVDADLRAVWADKQSQLDPITVGSQGQVKEWYEETTLGRAQTGTLPEEAIWNFGAGGGANQGSVHRHASQLLGLFPGTLINQDTPEWMDAAIVSLRQRGLEGTGWAKAMKINMYARTGLADDTYSMVSAMLAGNRNGLMDNLLDSHPPFQIDGNFGLTAGMTEMLLQSHAGYVQFLPALPGAWPNGSVDGLVARGNFVVDQSWADGEAVEFHVTARNGGRFSAHYPGLADMFVTDVSGRSVEVDTDGEDRVAFDAQAGETYRFRWEAPVSPSPTASPTSTVSPTPSASPTPGVTRSPSASPTPGVTQSPRPTTPQPSATPTTPSYVRTAPYTLPGNHNLNGRQWMTSCESYSQTERCRTDIWATVVQIENGEFVRKSGWVFNNLTYLPLMSREAWRGNPLGDLGSTVDGVFESAGRQWRTECDTAATGRGACRSYTMTTVYAATAKPEGGYVFSQSNEWVFNNIVMFSTG